MLQEVALIEHPQHLLHAEIQLGENCRQLSGRPARSGTLQQDSGCSLARLISAISIRAVNSGQVR